MPSGCSKSLREFKRKGTDVHILDFNDDARDWPAEEEEGMLIPFTIGARGHLTKYEARHAARTWQKAIKHYPNAMFYLNLLGYDEDPREVWEISDAARYVRWFARFSGLDDFDTADHWFGPASALSQFIPDRPGAGLVFLAGCGVFGEAVKEQVLRDMKRTITQ